jgi:hypothetical protein
MGKKKAPKKAMPKHEPKSAGRPTSFTQELGDLICALLAEGKSLRKICALEEMPSVSTVLLWVMKGERGDEAYADFSEQYRVAREAQAEYLADEIVDISDDQTQDELFTDEGKRVCNAEFVMRSKLRVDARKWFASKLRPKKYGEKIHQEHTGADGKDLPSGPTNIIIGEMQGKSLDELTKLFTDKIKG